MGLVRPLKWPRLTLLLRSAYLADRGGLSSLPTRAQSHFLCGDHVISYISSLKIRHNLSNEWWNNFPSVFKHCTLPSLDRVKVQVWFLAGVEPTLYDCCTNSCCAFTGHCANFTMCDICNHPRLRNTSEPYKAFSYFPLIPQLSKLYEHPVLSWLLRHRHLHKHTEGKYTDVFDGMHYRRLKQRPVKVGDTTYDHFYFCGERDIAIGLSTDGFSPFKSWKHSAWPIIIFNYNLPPHVRFHQQNLLCVGVIPGPKGVWDIDSFILPLVEELAKLAVGVSAYDSQNCEIFCLRTHLILAFGDMPAIAKILCMMGHNGLCPCQMCKIIGVRM